MKFLAQILAIYFLLLSAMPCMDGQPCSSFTGEETVETQQQESHEHQDHHDHCTPLCACACCGVSFLVPDLQDCSFSVTLLNPPFAGDCVEHYSFLFAGGVWHPPSLG